LAPAGVIATSASAAAKYAAEIFMKNVSPYDVAPNPGNTRDAIRERSASRQRPPPHRCERRPVAKMRIQLQRMESIPGKMNI